MNPPSETKPTRFPRRWVWVVVALLAGHITLMTTAVTLAVRGHGAAGITPDYYNKAVSWDETRERERRTDALGWTVSVTPDIWLDEQGRCEVVIFAVDNAGNGVEGATVRLDAYHRLAPDLKAQGVATETEPGRYAARLPMTRPGEWRIAVVIEAGDKTYERAFDQPIAAPTANGGAG